MKIVLLRHGRPDIDQDRRLSASEFGAWVSGYDAAGIDAACPPPQSAIDAAASCSFVVCSTLRRSSASARALGLGRIDAGEAMFREMEMPHADWPSPRLPAAAWAVFFRLCWALGYAAKVESFVAAKRRALRCAERLADLAAEHRTVLLVGHGSLNWFIARHLKRMGWSGPKSAPRKYWEYGIYRYDAAR